MKLATFSTDGNPRLGLAVDQGIVDLARHAPRAPEEMIALMHQWDDLRPTLEHAARARADYTMDEVKLHAPVLRPGKVLALGLNYADHVAEAGLEMPAHQTWFCKHVTAVHGPFDPIELPPVSTALDHECELVFVIGKRCRYVPRERAHEVIFGYCVGNDVSVRDWQLRTPQWMLGKSFDTHAPFGPWLTTADGVDPHNLGIRCLVNGEIRQQSNTRHFIFDCFAQVAHLSQAMTLEPGDVVFTGTCAGIGATRNPPMFLREGDVVRVEADQLGAIEAVVRQGQLRTMIE